MGFDNRSFLQTRTSNWTEISVSHNSNKHCTNQAKPCMLMVVLLKVCGKIFQIFLRYSRQKVTVKKWTGRQQHKNQYVPLGERSEVLRKRKVSDYWMYLLGRQAVSARYMESGHIHVDKVHTASWVIHWLDAVHVWP